MTNFNAITTANQHLQYARPMPATPRAGAANANGFSIGGGHAGCGTAHGGGAPQKAAAGATQVGGAWGPAHMQAPQKFAAQTQVGGAFGPGAGVAQLFGGGGADTAALTQALQSIMTMMNQLVAALGGMATNVAGSSGGGVSAPTKSPGEVGGASGSGTSAPAKAPSTDTTQVGGVSGDSTTIAAPTKDSSAVAGASGDAVQSPPQKQPSGVGGVASPVPTQGTPAQGAPGQVVGGDGSVDPGTDVSAPGGGAAPVAGDVTLSDKDFGDRVTLKSAAGNSVEIYGDPHVTMKLNGKSHRFDIGSGPGRIELKDGTVISWATYERGEGGSIKNLKSFSIDSAGTEFDREVRTNDGRNDKDLTTTLTDEQLMEFATELYAYKGSVGKPLTRSGATLPR